jgi:membrane-bound metal-dependent hydrolase YbcI (DUF457 family)
MTPAGHTSVSYLAGIRIPWLSMGALVAGGLLPDVDYLLYFSPWFSSIHRVITHNIFFVLVASLAVLPFVSPGMKARVFLSLFLGGMLHLLTDACLDNYPANGIGVAILWPLSDAFFSPFNLLDPRVTAVWWPGFLPRRMSVIDSIVWDVPFIAAAVVIFFRRRKEKTARG